MSTFNVVNHVFAVVDVVDWEGRHVVQVFQSRQAAEKYAQEHYRGATGRLTVDEWEVNE